MFHLSQAFPTQVSTPSLSGQAASQPLQRANVVVEKFSDRKLPRFSGHEKLGQREVPYRKWQRCANRLIDDVDIPVSKEKDCFEIFDRRS